MIEEATVKMQCIVERKFKVPKKLCDELMRGRPGPEAVALFNGELADLHATNFDHLLGLGIPKLTYMRVETDDKHVVERGQDAFDTLDEVKEVEKW